MNGPKKKKVMDDVQTSDRGGWKTFTATED